MVEAVGPAVCMDGHQPLDIGRGGSVGSLVASPATGHPTWPSAPPSRLTHGTTTTPAQPRNLREEGGQRQEAGAVRDELDNQVITEEAEDSGEGSDGKAIGDEFYHSPNSGADGEKIVIASLSVTVTGLLGAHGGGEARGGFHQQQQQQQQQQQEQKQHQTQSLEEATEQEPAYKISPPSSPTSTNNNNSNSSNLILPTNYPDQSENNQQQPTGQQLHLPFPNPENGQLASQQPLVSHSQDSVLGTSYASSCNVVGEFPMMTATTESVFLNLLVKNEPEDLTGHRERQGDFLFSRDTYAVLLAVLSHLDCRLVFRAVILLRLDGRLDLVLVGDGHAQVESGQAGHGDHQHGERGPRHPAQ